MANITPYTDQIRTARYGEQVRGSIVNALEAMNDDINDDTQSAGAYAQRAQASAQSASQTASDLSSTLTQIETDMEAYDAAEQSRDTAEQERVSAEAARKTAEQEREDTESGYVAQARTYAQTAAQHASSDNATLSRSWAEGNTGYRDGEDLNNAKYWAQQARQAAYGEAVISFNGRSGSVVPMADDYSASMISRGTGTVESSLSALDAAIQTKADSESVFAFDKTGTAISSGDDLNDYLTPGIARSTSGTISASLSNVPWTSGGFLLLTMYTVNTASRIQFLFPIALSIGNGIFVRTYRNSAWDAWLKIALTTA